MATVRIFEVMLGKTLNHFAYNSVGLCNIASLLLLSNVMGVGELVLSTTSC
jgi:hypothetical protein